MLKSYIYNLIFLFILISISFVSFLPNYNNLPDIASLSDSLNHFIAFFTLTLFMVKIYKLCQKEIFFYLLTYGFAIESFQYFLPNRVFGIDDIIFDMLGVVIFFAISKKVTIVTGN